MSRSEISIRPSQTNNFVEVGDGLGVKAGRGRRGGRARGVGFCATFVEACPCCPIARGDSQVDETAFDHVAEGERAKTSSFIIRKSYFQARNNKALFKHVTRLAVSSG